MLSDTKTVDLICMQRRHVHVSWIRKSYNVSLPLPSRSLLFRLLCCLAFTLCTIGTLCCLGIPSALSPLGLDLLPLLFIDAEAEDWSEADGDEEQKNCNQTELHCEWEAMRGKVRNYVEESTTIS